MNKLFLSTVCWLMLGVILRADPPSAPKGVMILTSASGQDPRNVLFIDQVWTGFDGGTIVDANGQRSDFATRDIGKIIYFDSSYYAQLDNDQQEKAFRAGIQAREVVVNTSFLNLDAATGLKTLQDSQNALESLAHEYPSIQSLVQPQVDLLKEDMTNLSSGQSLLSGIWMSQQEAAIKGAVPVVGETKKPVTFTTKDGKQYQNATVSVTDTGLSVLTSDGGGSVAFDQLPDDLSVLPESVRRMIDEKRQSRLTTNAVASTNSAPSPTATSTPDADTPISTPSSKEDDAGSSSGNLEVQEQEIWTEVNMICNDPHAYEQVETPAPGGGTFGEIKCGVAIRQLIKKIDSITESCDSQLPNDVKVALDFLRSKYQDNSYLGTKERLVILPHLGVFFYFVPHPFIIQMVSIKDLNPDDIVERSLNSDNENLDLYTTGRKPVVDALANGVPHLPCLTLAPQDDVTNQRVVNALTDVIKYYGGKPEPSIDDAKTAQQLTAFIQERLEKAKLRRPITFSFNEKNGMITLILNPLPGWTPPSTQEGIRPGDALFGTITQSINVKDMKPEDFTWTKSGEQPSTLNVGIIDEVDFRGNKIQFPGRRHELINCATEQDAADVAMAFQHLCELNGWTPPKY